MRLEGVTTCVQYGDFLVETLPLNKQHFDHLVVVTTPEDEETQRICEFNHVDCVTTDAFGPEGEFRKGAAINVGLQELDKTGWVVHVDADVALPPRTRSMIENAHLDERMVYGIDRFNVHGYRAWRRFLRHPRLQQENDAYVHLRAFPLATRFITSTYGGYVPIGFFQMWSPSGSDVRVYPEQHTSAGRSDMLFVKNWSRARRALLPEIVGYHLESCVNAPQGANWSGRKTPRFEHVGILRRLWAWLTHGGANELHLPTEPYDD